MRRGCLLLWRVLGLLVGVSSEVGVLLLGRDPVVGLLVAGAFWAISGVVLVGSLLPLRVRAPNVRYGSKDCGGGRFV